MKPKREAKAMNRREWSFRASANNAKALISETVNVADAIVVASVQRAIAKVAATRLAKAMSALINRAPNAPKVTNLASRVVSAPRAPNRVKRANRVKAANRVRRAVNVWKAKLSRGASVNRVKIASPRPE